jgi:hypothetical protein
MNDCAASNRNESVPVSFWLNRVDPQTTVAGTPNPPRRPEMQDESGQIPAGQVESGHHIVIKGSLSDANFAFP